MHSIRSKLMLFVFGALIGVFILLAGVSICYIYSVSESDSEQTIGIIAGQKVREINSDLTQIEHTVENLGVYVRDNADIELMKNDSDAMDKFFFDLSVCMRDEVKLSGEVETVYFRPEPNTYGSESGVFLTNNGYGEYISITPTDIFQYSKDDLEHVGWYYEPLNNGKALWIAPYVNRNIDVYMVSYAEPIYVEGEFFGVVGMDVKMDALCRTVDSIEYMSGSGFLIGESGDIVYHKDYPDGLKEVLFDDEMKDTVRLLKSRSVTSYEVKTCTWNGRKQKAASGDLVNGMTLAVSVPLGEIMRPTYIMCFSMMAAFIAVLMAAFIVIRQLNVTIVEPIRELTSASSKIAKGELNVPINYTSKDEIGSLADCIRMMAKELREYIAYIHTQAYTDAITGVGNKSAYVDAVKVLDRKIREEMAEFIVIVLDINGLKRVNDVMGHEYGDMLISDSADVLKKVFGAEYIYRIGGDEFVVIIENRGFAEIDAYYKSFDDVVRMFNDGEKKYEIPLAISKGAACFEAGVDEEFKDVFKRADEAMYKDKEAYYKGRNDRRRR